MSDWKIENHNEKKHHSSIRSSELSNWIRGEKLSYGEVVGRYTQISSYFPITDVCTTRPSASRSQTGRGGNSPPFVFVPPT